VPRNIEPAVRLGEIAVGAYFRFADNLSGTIYQRICPGAPGQAADNNWTFGVEWQPSEDENSVYFVESGSGKLYRGLARFLVVEEKTVMLFARIDNQDRIF
jgi:hypothetical protein